MEATALGAALMAALSINQISLGCSIYCNNARACLTQMDEN